MTLNDIRIYTEYRLVFKEPQVLRCFKGPRKARKEATVTFFPGYFGILCYKSRSASSGYGFDADMMANVESFEVLA